MTDQAGHMDILNLPIQYVTTTRYWYVSVRPCVCNVPLDISSVNAVMTRSNSDRLLGWICCCYTTCSARYPLAGAAQVRIDAQ